MIKGVKDYPVQCVKVVNDAGQANLIRSVSDQSLHVITSTPKIKADIKTPSKSESFVDQSVHKPNNSSQIIFQNTDQYFITLDQLEQ